MTCHTDDDGNWILLRNHELGGDDWIIDVGLEPAVLRTGRTDIDRDQPLGGVARIVIDRQVLSSELTAASGAVSEAVMSSQLILNGTDRNCAGGTTNDGWVTCEESETAG